MSKITFNIEYAGLQLLVGKNERGEDVTPLKPISDLFGLRWDRQRDKVTKSAHFGKFLGVCTLHMWGADGQKREQNCILVSRVAAFIMTISPDAVRAQGNESAADFLEQKLNEWADALHDYEEVGVAFNLNHVRMQEYRLKADRSLAQIIAIKNKTEPKSDRNLLEQMIRAQAKEAGHVYQPDLLDTPSS